MRARAAAPRYTSPQTIFPGPTMSAVRVCHPGRAVVGAKRSGLLCARIVSTLTGALARASLVPTAAALERPMADWPAGEIAAAWEWEARNRDRGTPAARVPAVRIWMP